jgi:hypothetical protein
VQAVTMDGAVRFIDDAIQPDVWQAMATRHGQEVAAPTN